MVWRVWPAARALRLDDGEDVPHTGDQQGSIGSRVMLVGVSWAEAFWASVAPVVQPFQEAGRERHRRAWIIYLGPLELYGTVWMMSIDATAQSAANLTSTSYLVLGLIEREGPSTPYELKRHVAATIGHFWSFPHALLYKEPPRLVELGLLTEEREGGGRRRRLFTITDAGRDAIRRWLAKPAQEPTELRDAGLLQLFFADLGPVDHRRALADAQLAVHRTALARYEDDRQAEGLLNGAESRARTVEHWRGVTLPMGLLYERAAVEFWEGVAAGSDGSGAAAE